MLHCYTMLGRIGFSLVLLLTAIVIGCGTEPAVEEAGVAQEPPYMVYVTNERSGELTIIDPTDFEAVDKIELGKRPRGIHLTKDGTAIFVALSGSPFAPPGVDESTLPPPDRTADGIGVVDLQSHELVRKIETGTDPEEFDFSADGSLLYVSNEDAGLLSMVEIATGEIVKQVPVGEEPEGVTVSPDGKFVYVTSENNGAISVIDLQSQELVKTIETCRRPRSIEFLPDGSRAYVSCENDAKLVVIDAIAQEKTGEIPIGEGMLPMGIVASRDGSTLYVTTGRGRSLMMVDVATGEVSEPIEVGDRPWGVALSPDGRYAFTANGPSNDVSVVDLTTRTVVQRIPSTEGPWGVLVVPSQSETETAAMNWKIDPGHSRVGFRVRHLMMSWVRGQFESFEGDLRFNPADPSTLEMNVTIDPTSINTGNAARDRDLQGEEFFQVADYPTIRYVSRSATPTETGARVVGDLTMRGVTKEVALDAEGFRQTVAQASGVVKTGGTATATIDRYDWGLVWNQPLEAGGLTLAKEVYLELDVELTQQN